MITGKRLLVPFLLFCLPAYLHAQQFGGNPSSLKWNQINNPQTRIIFPRGMDSQANRINNINRLLKNTTAYSIGGNQRKWNIILLNQATIANAYVRMAPIMSELNLVPDQNNFTTGSLRSDDNLIIHENRHIQQFSNFNTGLTKVFSFFLGQEGQLLANGIAIPDYFFEGDAVWQETLVSAQGRGRMPSFYNGMKSLWLGDKNYSWMKLRSGSLKDYTPDYYQLGYQLVAYGYEKYGEDFWRKVTADAVHFKGLFYAFNKAIERHSGKTYQQFREDALQYFKERSITVELKNTPPVNYITAVTKNNVTDYLFPAFVNDDTIVVTKQSYKENSSFYLLVNGKEQKIRVKDIVIDDYFSYRNGRIVYAAYQSDPRWANRSYSVIRLLDIHTRQQRQLSSRSKYFSPDINEDGSEVLAVSVNPNGNNSLHRISAGSGELTKELPNPHNYFFTQTKYIDNNTAISAVRNPEGKMCLVKVDLTNGETERMTPFSFNVIGYPLVKGDTVYFSAMNKNADKIFAVRMSDKKVFQLTNNINGIYQPAINSKGEMLFTAFTADGSRLGKMDLAAKKWPEVNDSNFTNTPDLYTVTALRKKGAGILYNLTDSSNTITPYRKGLHLFNYHSWRPEVNDPEYSYSLYSDNVLSSFNNTVQYTFNRSDHSHTFGVFETFAGWFPVLSLGTEYTLNRSLDTALGKSVQFNAGKLNARISIPLSFIGGRTSKFLNFGGGYNIEQLYYRGIGKNVFDNKSVKYTNFFLAFSNASRQARQHINPRWAQSISLSYRDAFTLINSHKFVGNSAFYFPGLFTNHSLVINASYQKRDTLGDLFSNNFSYSRGYEALSTRRMYKLGANYHFPLVYPDWGFGNMIFFQRIRANAFYDHTIAHARVSGKLTDIKNRSAGTEIYFDTKVWNALPVSFGVRFSHLLDTDLRNPGAKNVWEFIVPIGLIPD
ncbi:MAG: hypothetical protein JWP81_4327 [Ferruginibacter sp.]|nr:hypothetical protein [Ferruginibacter sp.]